MEYVAIISSAAKTVGLLPALLLSVCFYESSFRNTVVPHDGHSASYGICQVKRSTAEDVEPGIYPSELLIPEVNARIAAEYLSQQIDRYHGCVNCAIDAYNKGHLVSRKSKYVRKVKHIMLAEPWNDL